MEIEQLINQTFFYGTRHVVTVGATKDSGIGKSFTQNATDFL